MEQFISDIEAYCARAGILPQQLLKEVVGANWGTWQRWKDGKSSPTMKLVDRIRVHMAATPSRDVAELPVQEGARDRRTKAMAENPPAADLEPQAATDNSESRKQCVSHDTSEGTRA